MVDRNLLRSRLAFIRQGSEVERFHTKRMLQKNDVGHHSFHVAWLVWLMCSARLGIRADRVVMAALAHDLAEHVTGDAPGDFKREAGLREMYGQFENDLFLGISLDFESILTEDERRVLKLADMMEGAFFCISEASLGNRRIANVFGNFREYVQRFAPFNEVETAIIEYIDELWLMYSGGSPRGSCPGWQTTAHKEESLDNDSIMGEPSPGLLGVLRTEEAEGRATPRPQSNAPIQGDAGVPKPPADDTVDDRATSDLGEEVHLPANARQHGGTHYKDSGYEHWDFVLDTGQHYLQGCATKYITRARKHDGGARINLLKAIHYVDKAQEAEAAGRWKNNTLYTVTDLSRYVAANALDETEGFTLGDIIAGRWDVAREKMQRMLAQYPAPDEE